MHTAVSFNNNLPIGEKLRLLRLAKGLSQADLAAIMLTNQSKVSEVESAEDTYSDDMVENAKAYFGVADMPFIELERKAFRERLYLWRDLIRDRRIPKAKELREKMRPITNLEPCDPFLSYLYRLYDVLYLLTEGDVENAATCLESIDVDSIKANHELHYNYLNRMGILKGLQGDKKNSLEYLLQAYEISHRLEYTSQDDEATLYLNIAVCYTNLEMPNRAIRFLYGVQRHRNISRTNVTGIYLDIELARSYSIIGEYDEAESILSDCLVKAKSIEDSQCIYLTLFYFGLLYRRSKQWSKSVEYFDKVLGIVDNDSVYRPWTKYYQIRAMIGGRDFSKAEDGISACLCLYDKDESFTILFISLQHLLAISRKSTTFNKEAADYIKNISVPHLVKLRASLEAISFCEVLEQHCIKTRKKIMALEASDKIRNLYENIFRR